MKSTNLPPPNELAYIERELEELRDRLPRVIQQELGGSLPVHRRGRELIWLYGRMSYLLELLGQYAAALTALDEGAAALTYTPLGAPAPWGRARVRIREKQTGEWREEGLGPDD